MSSSGVSLAIKKEASKIIFYLKNYSKEFSVFLLVFVVVFSALKLSTGAGSNGNSEQWINITNQMFYGEQDFLFSYGPLYWLVGGGTTQYNPYTYWSAIVFLSFLSAYFWAATVTLSYKANTYILYAVAYFLFFNSLSFSAVQFLWPLATIAYLEFSRPRPITLGVKGLMLLGVLIGISFYIRFFYGVVSLAAFSAYFALDFFRGVKVREAISFFGGVILSYLLCGMLIFHDAISVVNYLLINKNLSFGNSVDMTLDVINSKESLVAVALTVLCINIYLVFERRSLFLPINALLLLFIKLGFSRTDHYIWYFVIPVAALSLIMLFERSWLSKALFALTISCLYYLSSHPSFPGGAVRDPLTTAINFKIDYVERLKQVYPSFKLDEPLLRKIGDSKIDVYPYNNEYAFANKLNYWYRPSFQNYMTLTPSLDLMNQRFFESSSRPKFVLWTGSQRCVTTGCNVFDGFDKKFTLNEDPLTSSTILMNYHIVDAQKGKNGVPLILLEENEDYKKYSASVVSEEKMRFGQWYKVPRAEGQVVKLVPDLKFTLYGKLKNLLFRGGVLKIKYKLLSGEVVEYRANILNSKSGIWVSPLLDSFDLSGLMVDSIMLESQSFHYFQEEFVSSWITVPISGAKVKLPPNSILPLAPNFEREIEVSCKGYIDYLNGVAPASSSVAVSNSFTISGWLALSTEKGEVFDNIFITLTGDDGEKLFVSTEGQNRPDVAAAFKFPKLSAAGFQKKAFLPELNGKYTLGLAGVHDAELYTCKQFSVPLTVK